MTDIILISIILFFTSIPSMILAVIGIYNIWKDKISKETMFQIQLQSAASTSMKDAIPVTELYSIVDGTIKFYTARQLVASNLEQRSDQELSVMIDDIILTIASNVEMHLSDKIKSMWEVYFDPIPTSKDDRPSHLNLYIHDNTKLILIRSIESMKGTNARAHRHTRTSNEQNDEPK